MAHCAVPTFTAREQAGEARHAFCTRDFFKLTTIRFIVTRKIKRIRLYFLNKIGFIGPLCSACLHCQRASREAGRQGGMLLVPGKTFRLTLALHSGLPGWLGKNLTAIFNAPFSSRTTFLSTPCTVAFFFSNS